MGASDTSIVKQQPVAVSPLALNKHQHVAFTDALQDNAGRTEECHNHEWGHINEPTPHMGCQIHLENIC